MFLRIARLVPANGILFAALVVAAALIVNRPGRDASDSTLLDYYQDGGNRDAEVIAFFLIGLAAFSFLSFLGSLRGALARSEGEPARLSTVVAAAGAAFIVLAVAAHVAGTAVAGTVEYFDEFQLDPDTARVLLALDYGFFVMSLFAAAAMTLAASVLALHTGVLPQWLAAFGLLATLAGLLGFLVWPSLLVLAWIVLVAAYLLWPQRQPPEAQVR